VDIGSPQLSEGAGPNGKARICKSAAAVSHDHSHDTATVNQGAVQRNYIGARLDLRPIARGSLNRQIEFHQGDDDMHYEAFLEIPVVHLTERSGHEDGSDFCD
jgi:hypothetical protein